MDVYCYVIYFMNYLARQLSHHASIYYVFLVPKLVGIFYNVYLWFIAIKAICSTMCGTHFMILKDSKQYILLFAALFHPTIIASLSVCYATNLLHDLILGCESYVNVNDFAMCVIV